MMNNSQTKFLLFNGIKQKYHIHTKWNVDEKAEANSSEEKIKGIWILNAVMPNNCHFYY